MQEQMKFGLVGRSAGLALLLAAGCTTVNTHPERDQIGPKPAAADAAVPGTPAAPAPPAAGVPLLPLAGPIRLTVNRTVLAVLENNRGLAVQRLDPQIKRTLEEIARAEFDPVLAAEIGRSRTRDEGFPPAPGSALINEGDYGSAELSQILPFGTKLALAASATRNQDPGVGPDFYSTRASLTATQSLLRGAGLDVNLASLRQARIDTEISEFELRGYTELLVADTEKLYWDTELARRQVEIVRSSLDLAEKQQAETRERITVGKLSPTEQAAADAEVATRREELINAENTLAQNRVKLMRLLNPPGQGAWDRDLMLESDPAAVTDEEPGAVADHVTLALKRRPEMNQARLQIQRNDIDLVVTRNGLLPKLDFFITLGQDGYGNSFRDARNDNDGANYDVTAGARLEFPLLNRDARARHTRARLSRDKAAEALGNLGQLAEEDVRSAYLELKRAQAQVGATTATRRLQEEKLRVEIEKFRVGKSTALQVAQVQRDLLTSQIAEARARAALRTGYVELYRVEGTLLDRRGLQCPGAVPVE